MAKFEVFVGRKQELALINEWADKWGTQQVILVQGPGGVGKTFLLQKVAQTYQKKINFAVVYYDLAEQPSGTLQEAVHLAESLGWEHFPEFRSTINDLASGRYDIADIRLPQLEREAFGAGIKELTEFVQQKRLLRITDTLEVIMPQRSKAKEFYQYLRAIPNALFVSAGRDARRFQPELEESFGPDRVACIDLKGFDRVEADEFFAEVDTAGLVAPDLRAKLHLLTNGRPVLLSLALEWLSRQVPLPEITEQSLQDLEALPENRLNDLRERFEFELVDLVRQLQGPLDRAVLYMAHIGRRNNAHILSVLLDVPLPEAQALVQQLTELSFVKYNPYTGSCLLHDEMKNLVNKHAWPYVDPMGEVRQGLARKIITHYYEPRINELTQQIKARIESDKGPIHRSLISEAEWECWRLEAECLHYHLKVSEKDGAAFFEGRFHEARSSNHIMRIQFLLGVMEMAEAVSLRALEPRQAEALLLRGEAAQARKICENILASANSSVESLITAHVTLGRMGASTDPHQAHQHYQIALELAQEKKDDRIIGILHNNVGQLYRLTGQLGQAVYHYQQAIEYSRRAGHQAMTASATNNLAYIYRLQGNLAEGDVMCRVALAQRRKLGLERDLAYSYLTKAEIDGDKGDLESAEHYTKLALRSFDKLDEIRGQIMSYLSLANIHRLLGQYEDAEAYLQHGIGLAVQINDEPLLANLLNVYGREQRSRALSADEPENGNRAEKRASLLNQAQEYLERSLALAEQYGDLWLLTRSQLELALTYFLGRLRPEDQVLEMLNHVWENASRAKPVLGEEHVLGAAEADAPGAEGEGHLGVARDVGVRADAELAHLVGPGQQLRELLVEHRLLRLELTLDDLDHLGGARRHRGQHDLAGRAVDRDGVALVDHLAGDLHRLVLGVDVERTAADHGGLAHLAADDGRVRRHAAGRGQDALRDRHAVDVVRHRLHADEQDLLALLGPGHRVVGGEDDGARGRARRGGQALGRDRHGLARLGVEDRVQQLVERLRLDLHDRFLLREQPLFAHVDRDLHRGETSPLAVAGLEHVEGVLLDRELEVLHVLVVPLELGRDLAQLPVGGRHQRLEVGDRVRGADAGHHVLALRVLQELAVELLGAVRGVAGETDARGGGVAHVAEHHRLHVHGGAEVVGDVVQLAVRDRARVHPGLEDGVTRAHQLRARVLRERFVRLPLHDRLVAHDHVVERLGVEVDVGLRPELLLDGRELVLELVLVDAEHDVAVHLDEAAVAVSGEAGVARLGLYAADRLVVHAQVEDGVHHAGHRELRAAADRDQQRVGRIAELLVLQGLEPRQRRVHLLVYLGRQATLVVGIARLCRDGEAGRHRHARVRHLGEAGALASEQVLHVLVAVGLAAAEEEDVLSHELPPSFDISAMR